MNPLARPGLASPRRRGLPVSMCFVAVRIGTRMSLLPERKRHCFRSAGACPPRSLKQNEKRPQPKRHGRLLSRLMHGEGQALALRGEEGSFR